MPEHWRLRRRATTATNSPGLRTSPAATFSDDDYGDFCRRTSEEQEAVDRDRSMVTHGHPFHVGR
ncbi:hypothetical protein [Nonomuraea sp. NPDC001831]|uniref:hypothetical protein n=1 Tax=Nonomuraea sp. NPDC001831 TaxID=3364340 RepID=UPI0036A5FE20